MAEAHHEYLSYRKKFVEIGKREPKYVKAKWRLARLRIRVSQAIRNIEFSEAVKRRLVERMRESVERIHEADGKIAKLEPKLRSKVSDDYKKQVRKQIQEQKDILRAIEDEFDTPHGRAEAHAASR